MNLINSLEKKYGRYAIQNVTIYLIAGQVLLFFLSLTAQFDMGLLFMVPALVLDGEWWRMLTFLFIPMRTSPIFIIFFWYLFYLFGSSLEQHWGTFRYNLFLLIGYALTVSVAFLTPLFPASNLFLWGSVFLAFAYLYPNFELHLFFILPVKIKWLALITWVLYAYQFIFGYWNSRLLVLAAVGNFLIFFGKDILLKVRYGRFKMASQARSFADQAKPFHRCAVCGSTDRSHPHLEFRYCPQCDGLGYCQDHIFKHDHVKKKA
jgi:hypothetical protein